MKRYSSGRQRPTRRRSGFTLIELLITIAIIAVLISLLLPALGAVKSRMRVTEVRSDISQLEAAIADFKFKFGNEPPSSITIYEEWTGGWVTDSANRAKIRKLWPKFNFQKSRNIGAATSYTLKGDQCLVFFLGGGYINGGTASAQFTGFSGDPTDPFKLASSSSTTRIGPFFDFDMGRVLDTSSLSYSAPLVNFPVYLDPYPDQTMPYLYATSYDGLGYDDSSTASDVHTAASDDTSTGAGVADFRVYRTDTKAASTDPDSPAWKPNGFQIISPGPDNEYGTGGPYKPDSNVKLPALLKSGGNDVASGARNPEKDNITNFASGKLDF